MREVPSHHYIETLSLWQGLARNDLLAHESPGAAVASSEGG